MTKDQSKRDELYKKIESLLLQWDTEDILWNADPSKPFPDSIKPLIDSLVKASLAHTNQILIEEWQKACQDNWQKPIPEQYALNRIKEWKGKQ